MNRKYIMLVVFIALFGVSSYYILFIKTKKYESSSVITVKDLSKEQSISSIGSMVLGQGNINLQQDLELLSLYIKSYGMYDLIDREFNLTNYYQSSAIDPLDRLYKDSRLFLWKLTKENLLNNILVI